MSAAHLSSSFIRYVREPTFFEYGPWVTYCRSSLSPEAFTP